MDKARHDAIVRLEGIALDETIGLGGYPGSAAYKLANADVSIEDLRGLVPDDVLDALQGCPPDWDEVEV